VVKVKITELNISTFSQPTYKIASRQRPHTIAHNNNKRTVHTSNLNSTLRCRLPREHIRYLSSHHTWRTYRLLHKCSLLTKLTYTFFLLKDGTKNNHYYRRNRRDRIPEPLPSHLSLNSIQLSSPAAALHPPRLPLPPFKKNQRTPKSNMPLAIYQ